MSGTSIDLAAEGGGVSLSGSNVAYVIVALVFALVAVGVLTVAYGRVPALVITWSESVR